MHAAFLFTKTFCSNVFPDVRFFLPVVASPAVEKTLSEGEEEHWMARTSRASLQDEGNGCGCFYRTPLGSISWRNLRAVASQVNCTARKELPCRLRLARLSGTQIHHQRSHSQAISLPTTSHPEYFRQCYSCTIPWSTEEPSSWLGVVRHCWARHVIQNAEGG